MGATYGTAKSGVGMASMGVMRPELVMNSIVPVVMAGVLGIYDFDHSCDHHSSVMESTQRQVLLSIYSMAMPISLPVSLWSCRSLRRYGYWNRRRCRCQSECTTTKALCGMILILIFAEALSLYGLIVGNGIILSSRGRQARVERTLKVS
ncbi:unnamed protein product [Brassica rapa subsp. narinosa]